MERKKDAYGRHSMPESYSHNKYPRWLGSTTLIDFIRKGKAPASMVVL